MVAWRRVCGRLPGRAVLRVAAAAGRRVLRGRQSRECLFLPADRCACRAAGRRARRLDQDRGADGARRRARRGATRHRTVHRVLALPAAGLASIVQPVAAHLNPRAGTHMAEIATSVVHPAGGTPGLPGVATDFASDKQAFVVPWGKAMMWIFLLSDTFIFSCFLTSYMHVRMSSTVPWPNPSEVFALTVFGQHIPLILIAIMTFILISSSGTMAMAVNMGYRRRRGKTAALMLITAGFGATFVGMQAFEWTKLIVDEGVRPWSNPMGAEQFGASFFMITGFHGLHVSAGVIYLVIVALKVWRGDYDRKGNYEIVEITGLYWHFVDLVWVFIFAFFYLW